MVVLDGTQPDETIQKEQKLFEELIAQHAEFEKTEVWGKKSLAYPIRKKKTGYYCLFLFNGDGDLSPVFDKYVRLNDNILRHLIVQRNLKNEAARLAVAQRKERAQLEDPVINDRESDGKRFDRD